MTRLRLGVAGRTAAPLTYLLLAVLAHLPAFADLADRTRCQCRDYPQADWFLAWTPHAVLAGRAPWRSDYLSIPHGVNLMWNTLMPLPGMLLAPVTLLAGPLASYTLLSVLAFAASATSMWWVVRRWAPWPPARFAAGLLYGFSPYEVAQGSGHVNLALVALPPLVLLLADEVLVRQRRSPKAAGALLGLVALAQLLTTEEVLASTFVMAVIGVAVLGRQQRAHLSRERLRRAGTGLGVAAGVLIVGAAWPLGVQFLGRDAVHDPVQNLSSYAADLLGAAVPTVFQLLGTTATAGWAGNASENGSYLGVTLLIATGLLAWRYRAEGIVRFAAAVGVAAWVLSLGERLHVAGTAYEVPLPFALLLHIPVLNSLAAVRFSLFVVLCVAVIVAVGLDRLHAQGVFARQVNRRRAAVAVLLCALPLLPKVPYSYVAATTPSYFTSTAVERIPDGAVALTYPLARFPYSAPMDWQAESAFRYRTAGGYVITTKEHGKGTFSGGQTVWEVVSSQAAGSPSPRVATQVQRRLLQEMTELHVRAVLVADGPAAAGVNQLVSIVLGREPDEHTGGVTAWYISSGPASGPLPD